MMKTKKGKKEKKIIKMSEIDEILKKLKIIIPNPPAPVGNYVAYNLIGNII